jgi:hypothetical protein
MDMVPSTKGGLHLNPIPIAEARGPEAEEVEDESGVL